MSSPGEHETAGASADEAMSRYAQGDAAAFDVVYEAVAPRLERFLRRRVRDKARLEDVIQQTFLQMHRARGAFMIGAEVLPWAYAIARHLMIDADRADRHEEQLDLAEDGAELPPSETPFAARVPSSEEEVAARELGTHLLGAYGRLTEAQRAAFELVKRDGLSHAQAAAVLGTSITGVKLRVHRAYLELRRVLANDIGSLPSS